MGAPETSEWVVVSGVVVAVLTSAVLAFNKIRQIVEPIGRWWSTRQERKLLRQAEIEAAALILNDQRIVALTEQVAFLAEQLSLSRVEIASLHSEIASLRSELAGYRVGGGAVDNTERVSES